MESATHPSLVREPDALRSIRKDIDDLDDQIVDLIARRFEHARKTLPVKARLGLGPVDTRREAEVVRRAAAGARARGIEPELVREIFWRLIELSRAPCAQAGGAP